MRTVHVQLGGGRGYDVIIGEGILKLVRERVESILGPGRSIFVLADSGVPSAHRAALGRGDEFAWKPSEAQKTLAETSKMLQALAAARVDRSGVVVALGGGVTGDVAGFAAATFQRGIPWVNCPTTLLAMVDSSVGGKTGVNLSIAGGRPDEPLTLKNMVGAFHQPILVVADIATLGSLPERTFASGLAECIKHALIAADWGDTSLFDWMRAALPGIRRRIAEPLIELIARNVAVKAAVVAADERELGESPNGGRMALNLGHTFAHAIEPLPGLSPDGNPAHAPLQHGEAVALGLIAATRCAAAAGLCPSELGDEVVSMVRDCGLPAAVRGLPPDDAILERMLHDKKSRGGVLRLILPTARGRVQLVTDPRPEWVKAGLAAIRL